MQEPSLLSHVSLRTVWRSTTLFSPACAPHADGVSPGPYSLRQIPPPWLGNPHPSLSHWDAAESIPTIVPTHMAWSFSRSVTQLWQCPSPQGRCLTELHSLDPVQMQDSVYSRTWTQRHWKCPLQKEEVWAQAVNISLPAKPCEKDAVCLSIYCSSRPLIILHRILANFPSCLWDVECVLVV